MQHTSAALERTLAQIGQFCHEVCFISFPSYLKRHPETHSDGIALEDTLCDAREDLEVRDLNDELVTVTLAYVVWLR